MLVKIGWHFYPSNEWLNEQISPLLIIRLPEVVSIISLNHFHRHLFSFVLSKDLLSLTSKSMDRSIVLPSSFVSWLGRDRCQKANPFLRLEKRRPIIRSFVCFFVWPFSTRNASPWLRVPSFEILSKTERERDQWWRGIIIQLGAAWRTAALLSVFSWAVDEDGLKRVDMQFQSEWYAFQLSIPSFQSRPRFIDSRRPEVALEDKWINVVWSYDTLRVKLNTSSHWRSIQFEDTYM